MIRFDYADPIYLDIALSAYREWLRPKYAGIFYESPFVVSTTTHGVGGREYIQKTGAALAERHIPWTELTDAETAKRIYPTLSGTLANPGFYGYHHRRAGWADANKAIAQLRDDCIEKGVSFVSGTAGTVVEFVTNADRTITAAKTLSGDLVHGEHFVLAAGAWSAGLASSYNSTISTGQVVGFVKLTDAEAERLKTMPIYINFSTGWFIFPPHPDTNMLKMAVHGWGYTRAMSDEEQQIVQRKVSAPPLRARRERADYVPADGETRLRQGLREVFPELGDRPFAQTALCWYTDTPTGDFIMDYHPDYSNLFMAGGGSGQ